MDLTLTKKNEHLIFNWFCKPTFSDRFLNFNSKHPMLHKKSISLTDRMHLLSHLEFHEKNSEWIINILLDNGYSIAFIFSTITKRLLIKFHHLNNLEFSNNDSKENMYERSRTNYFTIPMFPTSQKILYNTLRISPT